MYSWEHHQSLGTLLSKGTPPGPDIGSAEAPIALAPLRPSLSASPSHHRLLAPGLPFPRCTEGSEHLSHSSIGTPSPSFPAAPSVKPYSALPRSPGDTIHYPQAGVRPLTCPWTHLPTPELPLWSRPRGWLPRAPPPASPTHPHLLRSRGVSRHFLGR